MTEVNLNFTINLKKFATLTVAEALWGSIIIRSEIKMYAHSIFDKDSTRGENEKKWRNIIQKVVKWSETLKLPDTLFKKLESTIVFIGEKVFNWYLYYFEDPWPEGPVAIYWTQNGVVDDRKNYQVWKKNKSKPFRFPKSLSGLPNRESHDLLGYALACIYADENFIRESLSTILKLIKVVIGMKVKDLASLRVNSVMCMLLLWYKSLTDSDYQFKEMYSNLKSKEYPKGYDKMFLHCIDLGLKKAAEYFYRKLKSDDKDSIVQQALWKCLSETFMKGRVQFRGRITEKNPEMIYYLLSKLSNERRRIFLSDKVAEVYAWFLGFWPYQELCPQLLDYFWVNIPKANKYLIFQAMFTIMGTVNQEKHYAFIQTIYQPLLKDLLTKSSYDLKKYIFGKTSAIFNLFERSDFGSIDVILEDSDSKALRREFININIYFYVYLTECGGHTKNIRNYMTRLQLRDKEKRYFLIFSEDPQLLEILIDSGRFDEADDLIEWQCGSNPEDMIKLRKEIKKLSATYCSSFVKSNKWDLIEKYLKWILNDDEESSDTRKKILSVEFVRDQFWFLWINNRRESLKAAQSKCLKFFKYFYKSDEKINSIIKKKLVNEDFVNSILVNAENIKVTSNFSINFDEIMEFCSVSSDKVKEIKQGILNSSPVVSWLQSCDYPEQFLVVNAVVDWVSNDENDKRLLITQALADYKKIGELSLVFLVYYLAAKIDSGKEALKVLFAEWIKVYGDIDEMKIVVRNLNLGLIGNKVMSDLTDLRDVQKILDLLDFCKSHSAKSILYKIEREL